MLRAEDRLLWYSTTHKDWEFCNTTAPLKVCLELHPKRCSERFRDGSQQIGGFPHLKLDCMALYSSPHNGTHG